MTGIINWNELWKTMRSGSAWRRAPEKDADFWDKYAKRCNESLMQSNERTERQITKMELYPEYSVLDIGSGVGRLAVPIAKKVKTVTALDPSKDMLAYLKENMKKEGVNNIVCTNKRWEDIELGEDIEPHDVVVASYSLGMFDMQETLAKIDAAAKRCVYLFEFVGGWMDEKFWKELHGERRPAWTGYIYLYNILHDMGICANVKIIDSDYEQQYDSLDDAVNKWKDMYDVPSEKEGVLTEYLTKILVERDGKLCLKRKSKSAMVWWKKNHECTEQRSQYPVGENPTR
ncbi:MAG TPA: class I SAM-dependent methyltransferase [Methanosarcinaceae archaeon]|nr:class I SAM-dependent methyltransferase [Methanosarcinaceae archaeon]